MALLGKSRNTVDTSINLLHLLETNFKFVLKDHEQTNVPEDKEQGTDRPKREDAELTEVQICDASDITNEEGVV